MVLVWVYVREICENIINRNLYFSCIPDVDVNIVESMKIILLQCAADQLDQERYVMHAASCGPTRLVILITSMVSMKRLVQLLYFIWSTTTQVFSSSWSWLHKSNEYLMCITFSYICKSFAIDYQQLLDFFL